MARTAEAAIDNYEVCPMILLHEAASRVRPVVKLSEDTVFPFCIIRLQGDLPRIATAHDTRIHCWVDLVYVKVGQTSYLQSQTFCNTTADAAFQCQIVVKDGSPLPLVLNETHFKKFAIPCLQRGSKSLANVVWLCDDDKQIKVTLPVNWTATCTQVMLTGQVTTFEAHHQPRQQELRGVQRKNGA